jgi:hypothetical protein
VLPACCRRTGTNPDEAWPSGFGTLRVAGRTILIPSQNGAVIVASTWAAGVAGLVLIAGLVVVAVATFRDRVPEGGLLLGVLGLSIVYNVVDDHGDVWLLAIPPILGVLREPSLGQSLRAPSTVTETSRAPSRVAGGGRSASTWPRGSSWWCSSARRSWLAAIGDDSTSL